MHLPHNLYQLTLAAYSVDAVCAYLIILYTRLRDSTPETLLLRNGAKYKIFIRHGRC